MCDVIEPIEGFLFNECCGYILNNLETLGTKDLPYEDLEKFFKLLLDKTEKVQRVEVKFANIPDIALYSKYAKKVLVDIEKSGYTSFIAYLLDFSKFLKTLGDSRFDKLIEFIDKYIDDWFAYDPEIHSQYRYADGRRVLKKDAIGVRPPTEEELREFNSSVCSEENYAKLINHLDQI